MKYLITIKCMINRKEMTLVLAIILRWSSVCNFMRAFVQKSRSNQAMGVSNSSPEVTLAPRSSTVTTSSGCSSMTTLEPGSPLSRLPHTLKKRLCHCLDQPHPTGKDWRLLAQKLGVDR